jgi:hypothetical protein
MVTSKLETIDRTTDRWTSFLKPVEHHQNDKSFSTAIYMYIRKSIWMAADFTTLRNILFTKLTVNNRGRLVLWKLESFMENEIKK